MTPNPRAHALSDGHHAKIVAVLLWAMFLSMSGLALGQAVPDAQVRGRVTDETGGVLPGVTVELRADAGAPEATVTTESGEFHFDGVRRGPYRLSFTLMNFGSLRRDVNVQQAVAQIDVVMQLSLNAEVTVIGKRTFANLADVQNPAENLVGIAQSASQGAITARQLDVRPIMRQGEVLETVPGLIITQHSGEGKANQYFLRGFNLDHGSDFSMTIAGTPVNMPTHAHSQGYSDINFLIPELVAGVQFSMGRISPIRAISPPRAPRTSPTPRPWIDPSCTSKPVPMISTGRSSPRLRKSERAIC